MEAKNINNQENKIEFIPPTLLRDYLNYLKSIRALSPSTIKEYSYDLRVFLEYMLARKFYNEDMEEFYKEFNPKTIDNKITPKFLENISIQDFYAYLSYLDNDRHDSPTTRARKISALKSFYKYLYQEIEVIKTNVADKLSSPKIRQRQPVYLTKFEAEKLLYTVKEEKNDFLRARDLSIIFTFLTTGMRLSELVSINVNDISSDHFKIIGKGNKERTIYLTDACIKLINDYIRVRKEYLKDQEVDALFISTHKKRMANRSVQATIDKYLEKAGFDTNTYSTHKLRHTAATLMYKYGHVDIRALKDILGHANVSTTQIYTHLDEEDLKEAVNKNPLSNLDI